MFLYIPDYNTYDRGLYFKPEEMPFPYSFDEKQLIQTVQLFDFSNYAKRLASYKEKIGMSENGTSCVRIEEYLEKTIIKKSC